MRSLSATITALAAGLALCFLLAASETGRAQDRPNILWITCEDISPHIGSFGDTYAVTPNIDHLAGQGVRYVNAFAPIGVCAPARSCLITGMYPPSIGSQHMRSKAVLPDHIKAFPVYLRQAGYYCSNNVKEDYNLAQRPVDAWDESSRTAHWRKRKPGQPFFSVFNFTTCHESQIRLAEAEYRRRTADFKPHELHDPALAAIPPYHPDTPEVRRDWARYADMITYMDKQVGRLLKQLKEDGLTDSTIVFFYSDHGAGMPRSKRWLYDSSLKVPMVIRFPKKYQHLAPGRPGGVTDRMVSFVDFGPTALSLAGVQVPGHVHGKPFLGGQTRPSRRYIYGFRDRMDERYDMIRAVRDNRYKYIRNYMPHVIYAQYIGYMYQMPTMRTWQTMYDEGSLVGPQRYFFEPKATEELYDTWADPHEVHNLAGVAEYEPVRKRLHEALRRWTADINDMGLLPEAEIYFRSASDTPYEMARDPRRYPRRRIEAAAELAGRRDPSATGDLLALMKDKDSAVRYWGMVGLVALGEGARPAQDGLTSALRDNAPNVRIAAAEALCHLGGHEDAMPVLLAALDHPSEWVRLHAANVLDGLDESALPVLGQLKAAFEKNQKNYPGRVLATMLKDFEDMEDRED